MQARRIPVQRGSTGITRKSKKVEEPVILTLSSDEEDDEKPQTKVGSVFFIFGVMIGASILLWLRAFLLATATNHEFLKYVLTFLSFSHCHSLYVLRVGE